ncbi:MAG: hypothetical protein JW881_07175 [Spirochaetales bacterium]|nr:hypothetical protein [Spirochaetales bacterium]
MKTDQRTIQDQIIGLSDSELLLRIAEGRESYREGVYELLSSEAKRRGMQYEAPALDEVKEGYIKNDRSNILIFGYAFSFLGGIIGIITGIYIQAAKMKDNDGKKVHVYNPEMRNHGKTMIALGFFMMLIGLPLLWWALQMIFYFLGLGT